MDDNSNIVVGVLTGSGRFAPEQTLMAVLPIVCLAQEIMFENELH
jgi:hypothetical protein